MLDEEATELFIIVCSTCFILAVTVRPRGYHPRKDLPLISAANATVKCSILICQHQD